MAAFLDPLCLIEIDDRIFEVCDHTFRYKSDVGKQTFTVPVGFRTDFASVPRLGVIYAMLGDTAHEPAVVHDYIYATALTSRKTADLVLLEAMAVTDLPWWRRWPIYAGVRAGGWYAWSQHRKQGNLSPGVSAILRDRL